MRSQWRRLLWAAFLSGCGFLGTTVWYFSTQKSTSNRGEIPLAQVGKVDDEVLRRSATRLLWNSVATGDSLFNGETIRTSERGEVRIQFEDGRFIDLEADTMIVLKKNQGEIALDLMEGSLFVNAKSDVQNSDKSNTAPSAGLVLNSSQGKVDLTGASANLARGKGASVDVQVLEGKAKIVNKNGQTQELNKGSSGAISDSGVNFNQQSLKILSPSTEKPTLVDPESEDKLLFAWKGFPPQWKIHLWAGQRRKELKEMGQVENTPEKILARIPIGKNFWKLVAHDPATNKVVGESSIYKLDVIGRFAPTVLFPTADLTLTTQGPTYDMVFKWQKGEEAQKVLLEVASDLTLKNKIASQYFTNEDHYKIGQLKDGDYFWRMSAYYPDSEKPMIGKTQRFTLQKPAPVAPKEPARIGWVTPDTATIQYFVSEPTLQLQWKAETRQEEIKDWQLITLEVGASAESKQKVKTNELQVKTKMGKAGSYRALVQAFNKEGIVIGQSTERVMNLQPFPLLASPKLLPLEGDLQAFEDGRSDIKWEPVTGAKEYDLIIKNAQGAELNRKKYTGSQTNLKGLLPGKYLLQVVAIDQYGRPGEQPQPRNLIVPDKSNVRAPSNFRVKVKDK